jgi:hypothetical protein
MRFGPLTIEKTLGAGFSLLGLFSMLFADFFTGLVWVLLGNALLLFSPTVDHSGRKRLVWDFQNVVAAGALLLALLLTAALLVIDVTG